MQLSNIRCLCRIRCAVYLRNLLLCMFLTSDGQINMTAIVVRDADAIAGVGGHQICGSSIQLRAVQHSWA